MLTLLIPLHDAFNFRLQPGAQLIPRRWDGDWLELIYNVSPELALYFHVHRQLTPLYFGVVDTAIAVPVPAPL